MNPARGTDSINHFANEMKILKITTLFAALLFTCLMVTPGGRASAQNSEAGGEEVVVPEALGPEAINELVSKLDAEQTEALSSLITLLSKSAATVAETPTAAGGDSFIESIEGGFEEFGDYLVAQAVNLPKMFAGVGSAITSLFEGRGFDGGLLLVGIFVLIIVIAAATEWAYNRATAKWRSDISETSPDGLVDTLKLLSVRALIQISSLIVFTIAALFAAHVLYTNELDELIATTFFLQAVLIPRFSAAMLRFVLAPNRSDLRLVSTDDRTATYIYRQMVRIAAVIGLALFVAAAMNYFRVDMQVTFRFWAGLLITAWVVYVTWRARKGLTDIIKGNEEHLTPGLERVAAWWPALSIIYIAFDWLTVQFSLSAGAETITAGRSAVSLALIIVAPFLDTMVRGIAAHLVPAMAGEGAVAEKAYEETRLCYVRMGRIVFFAVLIIAIAKLRGLSLYNLTETGLGSTIAANGVGFLLVLAVGYMAWEVTNLWINQRLAREIPVEQGATEGGEAGGMGLSRMATILPILRLALQASIITITVLLALSQLGVNITPLLAGAGVLGLAIGFGAQTLVKDVVSGVFFLLDDAFRVGEYIDVGGTEGTVEKISIRSLQLRGATGPVHIVPYGSMSMLTNMSRDWVTMKLKFTVPFDTDLEKVRKIFKKIGQQLQEVPEYAEELISPFKSQGGVDVTDVGIVVRGKFTTKPGGQWGLRKEIYTRVQQAFEENGIEFARKEVRVRWSDDEEERPLTPDQKQAVSGAAADAAERPA